MSLHGLLSATIGVPNAAETAAYYTDFGLEPAADGWLSSRDAGRQLRIVNAPARRLVELRVGADDADDLGRAAANLARLGAAHGRHGASLAAVEPVTGTRVVLDVAPRLRQDPVAAAVYNGPGRLDRLGNRAPAGRPAVHAGDCGGVSRRSRVPSALRGGPGGNRAAAWSGWAVSGVAGG